MVSDGVGGSFFVEYMKIEFVEYTMMRNRIQNDSEAGIREDRSKWRSFAGITSDN